MITLSEIALQKIVNSKERIGLPVKRLRIHLISRSQLRANFSLRFLPVEEPKSTVDLVQSYDGIDLYMAPDSASYLEGATIGFVFSLLGRKFKVEAPLRELDTPEGRTPKRYSRFSMRTFIRRWRRMAAVPH